MLLTAYCDTLLHKVHIAFFSWIEISRTNLYLSRDKNSLIDIHIRVLNVVFHYHPIKMVKYIFHVD